MNISPDNSVKNMGMAEGAGANGGAASIDAALRAIAHAPVPAGIEERVHAALRSAPRHSLVLAWPAAFAGNSNWLRAAAAAAIVFVVAGGGWGVYMHVQRPMAGVVTIPVAQPAAGGGFSSAGAMRTPATVKGPMAVQPASRAQAKHRKKAGATAKVQPVPAAAAK